MTKTCQIQKNWKENKHNTFRVSCPDRKGKCFLAHSLHKISNNFFGQKKVRGLMPSQKRQLTRANCHKNQERERERDVVGIKAASMYEH